MTDLKTRLMTKEGREKLRTVVKATYQTKHELVMQCLALLDVIDDQAKAFKYAHDDLSVCKAENEALKQPAPWLDAPDGPGLTLCQVSYFDGGVHYVVYNFKLKNGVLKNIQHEHSTIESIFKSAEILGATLRFSPPITPPDPPGGA